tara:strand:- start:212 stop:1324 length:1113 start_codon:yes stop_codon:yes gene_type:complete
MAESWAGGLNTGLFKGFQIGSMLEEGKARKEKGEATTRMEERKKYMDQINISTSFFSNKAAHNDAKLEEYLGPYSDAVEKITGKKPVALTSWGPNIPEYTKRLNDILKDDSLTRKQKFVSARALEAEAKGDPQVAGMVSVGIEEEKREGKLAHENNKNQAIQLIVEFKHNKARVEPGSVEAKALATDFYTKLKKIDPRAVGAATEELNIVLSGEGEEATTIPYEREKPLTGTGYRSTATGVRVVDTPQGPMAFVEDGTGKWKQVPYDKTKHGLEKEKLEPGDEKHKILMDPAFAADLEKAFRILGLRESGETKDKNGNPLPTEREVRNRMIKLYPAIHKDIDDMLRKDGNGEMTFTVGGKTFYIGKAIKP